MSDNVRENPAFAVTGARNGHATLVIGNAMPSGVASMLIGGLLALLISQRIWPAPRLMKPAPLTVIAVVSRVGPPMGKMEEMRTLAMSYSVKSSVPPRLPMSGVVVSPLRSSASR